MLQCIQSEVSLAPCIGMTVNCNNTALFVKFIAFGDGGHGCRGTALVDCSGFELLRIVGDAGYSLKQKACAGGEALLHAVTSSCKAASSDRLQGSRNSATDAEIKG